jgi:benzoyl-CoA reductase subunit C
MWKDLFPDRFVRLLDPPQACDGAAPARFWRHELEQLYADLCELGGRKPSVEALAHAIQDYAAVRSALRALHQARREAPWSFPVDEVYLVRRAGDAMPPGDYVALVQRYLELGKGRRARREDRIRVVVAGAFCEQPPLGLLRAIERAGCYVVDDDLLLCEREGSPAELLASGQATDPLEAVALAGLADTAASAVRYDRNGDHGAQLAARARRLGADGVILAAPSFCDPALLDQPRLQRALDDAKVPYTSFKYAENSGQFQSIREQAGTFSDAVKLWGSA